MSKEPMDVSPLKRQSSILNFISKSPRKLMQSDTKLKKLHANGGANNGKRKLASDENSDGDEAPPWKVAAASYDNGRTRTRKRAVRLPKFNGDTEKYRHGYPGKKDDLTKKANLLFYRNEMPSKPDGNFIEDILSKWHGNYQLLESHHGYIQWLFPIREPGMNWHAQELQLHEATAISADPFTRSRVIRSYKLMLDFYGINLDCEKTGKVKRSSNWKERYKHLNNSNHNYLRITRILKSLGELGFEKLKAPLVEHFLSESLDSKVLVNCAQSCIDYWLLTLKNHRKREEMMKYVEAVIESDNSDQDIA